MFVAHASIKSTTWNATNFRPGDRIQLKQRDIVVSAMLREELACRFKRVICELPLITTDDMPVIVYCLRTEGRVDLVQRPSLLSPPRQCGAKEVITYMLNNPESVGLT